MQTLVCRNVNVESRSRYVDVDMLKKCCRNVDVEMQHVEM